MVNRICISINNRCNLNCKYCHFHEKSDHIISSDMNVYSILDNVKTHIEKYDIPLFKIGFVGNGEPLLDYPKLKEYIVYIGDYLKNGVISAYTITNGLLFDEDILHFFREYNVNVGFSIDGIKEIHDKWRCNSFDTVLEKIELYHKIYGVYPSMNCTVGQDVLDCADETIAFFKQFGNRITFSRMIGVNSISMKDFKAFIDKAAKSLNVRTGGYDCTMYGGKCGAGINNLYYANGKVYICGNCVDLPTKFTVDTPIDEMNFNIQPFDRQFCYKEGLK